MVRFEEMGSSLEVFISNIQSARECWPTHQSSLKLNAENSGEGKAFRNACRRILSVLGSAGTQRSLGLLGHPGREWKVAAAL